MYCSQCGSHVKEGAKYCRVCGAKLDLDDEGATSYGASPRQGAGAAKPTPQDAPQPSPAAAAPATSGGAVAPGDKGAAQAKSAPTPAPAPSKGASSAQQAPSEGKPDKPKSHAGRNVAITLTILILIAAACVGYYWYQGGFAKEFEGTLTAQVTISPANSLSSAQAETTNAYVTVDGDDLTISAGGKLTGKVTSNEVDGDHFLVRCNSLKGDLMGDGLPSNLTLTLVIPKGISHGNVTGGNIGVMVEGGSGNSIAGLSCVFAFNSDGTMSLEYSESADTTQAKVELEAWTGSSFESDQDAADAFADLSPTWQREDDGVSVSVKGYGEANANVDVRISYSK
ncbi:MAG: zinc-ribbon domain-containing protein [Coriobacteriales bacterium]|jgi:hypothetical protein